MADFAVELSNVSKRFAGPAGTAEDVMAVDHVTLQIRDGEFFSMLGPSGCGKTTSLRLIAGFELPTAGEVRIHGTPMGDTPPYRRPINTVFQHYALFPHLTVGENVAFGLEMKRVPRAEIGPRVARALERVRLPGMERRQPRQLSGGQQQRVALARALINQPEVLLLDEPLGALDLKLRKEMQLELKTLQREVGITFIYVTHDQEEALTMSDRIAVMNRGRVLQVGTPSEVYERPASRFVADFIGETNFLDGRVQAQRGPLADVVLPGGLVLAAAAETPLAGGQAVTLAVRPEKLSLCRPAEDGAAGLHGTVEEVTYIGTDTHYRVRLAGDQTVRVRAQNSRPGLRPLAQAGEAVVVAFAPEAARILLE
jgi:spermidine/putrescine transport system ATP-binding protein